MAYLIFHKREDVEQFENALMEAKHGIKKACEIFDDMKEQFGERRGGGYDERGGYGERYDGRYSNRGGYDERNYYRREPDWDERRDSRGRYM